MHVDAIATPSVRLTKMNAFFTCPQYKLERVSRQVHVLAIVMLPVGVRLPMRSAVHYPECAMLYAVLMLIALSCLGSLWLNSRLAVPLFVLATLALAIAFWMDMKTPLTVSL